MCTVVIQCTRLYVRNLLWTEVYILDLILYLVLVHCTHWNPTIRISFSSHSIRSNSCLNTLSHSFTLKQLFVFIHFPPRLVTSSFPFSTPLTCRLSLSLSLSLSVSLFFAFPVSLTPLHPPPHYYYIICSCQSPPDLVLLSSWPLRLLISTPINNTPINIILTNTIPNLQALPLL